MYFSISKKNLDLKMRFPKFSYCRQSITVIYNVFICEYCEYSECFGAMKSYSFPVSFTYNQVLNPELPPVYAKAEFL